MQNIIIGGPCRSGKTTISKLYQKKGFNHYKMDSIKRGIMNNFYEGTISLIDCSDKIAYLINTIIGETKTDIIYNEESLVIDTCHLYPHDIIKYNLENEIIVFMGYPNIDEESKLLEVRSNDKSNIWTTQVNDEVLLSYLKEGIEFSKEIKEECRIYNLPFFDVSNNFNSSIEKSIDYINDKLGIETVKKYRK